MRYQYQQLGSYNGISTILRENYRPMQEPSYPENNMAIVALIRGREDGYKDFLSRTRSILNQEWSKRYDQIVVHEGDITASDQRQIIRDLNIDIEFIDIASHFETGKKRTEKAKENPPANCKYFDSNNTEYGYKTMCDFWFRLFPTVIPRRYKSILRIDDDVILEPNLTDPTPEDDVVFSSAQYQGLDDANVIHGLEQFSREFSHENSLIWKSDGIWRSPITNVMYIKMTFARSPIVRKFQETVDISNCIYSNRWGDLPLWGALLTMLNLPEHTMKLRYSHGSWGGRMLGQE